jgi:hypothetical protein
MIMKGIYVICLHQAIWFGLMSCRWVGKRAEKEGTYAASSLCRGNSIQDLNIFYKINMIKIILIYFGFWEFDHDKLSQRHLSLS